MLTAAAPVVKYLLAGEATLRFAWPAMLELLVAGSAMAGEATLCLGNIRVLRGNLTLLGPQASASYFTPVLSTLFAALWLSTRLTMAFWQGVLMVTAGSLRWRRRAPAARQASRKGTAH